MQQQTIQILLVEDCPSDAEIIKHSLSNHSRIDHKLDVANSFSQAKKELESNQYDVLLVDLHLPDSTGLDTIISMRNLAPDLPIVAITGDLHEDVGLGTIQAGADEYVSKNHLNADLLVRGIEFALERVRINRTARDESNRLLKAKNDKLARMYQMSQQFVDNVSHEFRTPLTVIREFAAIVRDGIDGPVTSEQETRLNILINRTDDLAEMVEDLLDTSKLESGLLRVHREDCSLSDIFDSLESLLLARANTKKISLTIEKPVPDVRVFCDEEKLRRILINLAVNAIKFTDRWGKILIRSKSIDCNQIVIEVQDNGNGIAEHQLQQIFERFHQCEPTTRTAGCKGFGLGLSIARSLAYLNLGSLNVASKEGTGSCFSVTVPKSDPTAVLACYFEQRRTTQRRKLHSNVLQLTTQVCRVIEITTDGTETEHQQIIDQEVGDFLRHQFGSFDLVFKSKNGWMVYAWCGETAYSELEIMLQQKWSQQKRNFFRCELPELTYRTCFVGLLPRDESKLLKIAGAAAANLASDKQKPLQTKNQGSGKKILVVEDEIELADVIRTRLISYGYQCQTVHDGKSCLSIADSFQPDAILLDIRLPNLDGLSVLKRLKSKPQTKSIPVVNLSASLNDRRKALDLGANYFVQKPFTAETVLSALDSVLFENTCSQQHSQSKL